jgi:hypothetical protein
MKRMMKLLLIVAVVTTLGLSAAAPVNAAGETNTSAVNVMVEGIPVQWTDVRPFIDGNDRTMVPLRAVADAMGLDVEWDAENRTAVFTGMVIGTWYVPYQRTYYVPIGSKESYYIDEINMREIGGGIERTTTVVPMDTEAVIVNDRTFAPIRFIAESFAYTVDWDEESRTVLIMAPAYLDPEMGCLGLDEEWGLFYIYRSRDYEEIASVELISALADGEEVYGEVDMIEGPHGAVAGLKLEWDCGLYVQHVAVTLQIVLKSGQTVLYNGTCDLTNYPR